jgi:hypothetical protein
MSTKTYDLRPIVIVTAAAFGLAISASNDLTTWTGSLSPISFAQAQDGPKGAGGPTGDHGKKGTGGSSDVGGRGSGQGGPSADSDAKGPKYGGAGSKPVPGTQGGKPVWAQEGVPSDLELGRLSVVRAPGQVIDRQTAEALSTLQPAFYNQVIAIADNATLTLEQKVAALQALVKLSFTDTTLVRIDSPLQNLGLYKDLMVDGKIVASTATYDTTSSATRALLLAAVFIGSASDKTITVSTATVDAINKIMALTLPTGLSATDVAGVAEAVRVAIAEAHG